MGSASVKIGFPLRTGTNENFDWLGEGDNYSHYSIHKAFALRAIFADLSFGYSWNLMDFLALRAYGEFTFMHFSWEASDGFGLYPFGEVTFNGPVVEYSQNWFLLSPGVSLIGRISPLFFTEGNLSYSPLIFCAAQDHHIQRETVFYDFPRWGHHLNLGAGFGIFLNPNIELKFSLAYRLITGSRGDTYINNLRYREASGAGYSALNISYGARIIFNKSRSAL